MAVPAHARIIAQFDKGEITRTDALMAVGARITKTVRELERVGEVCLAVDAAHLYVDVRAVALAAVGLSDAFNKALASAREADKAAAQQRLLDEVEASLGKLVVQ